MKEHRFVLIAIFLCALGINTLDAQIPRTLSYQGVLTDNAGKPRPDGSYTFTFRFYTSPTGGAAIWSESRSLPVKNGLFSTVLGDQTSFGAAVKFDQQYWLSIQVGNEPELSPRIPLTSVGYSLGAMRADTAKVALVSLQTSTSHNCTDCNVKQMPYNAVGDGIADDRQAFVNAIANCGSIFIPTGIYRWSSGIITDRPIRLTGSSPSTSVIRVDAGDGLVIGGSEVIRPTIQELTIIGQSGRGLVLTNSKGALVQHVAVAGFSGGGIVINGINSLHVSLRDVRVAGPLPFPQRAGYTASRALRCESRMPMYLNMRLYSALLLMGFTRRATSSKMVDMATIESMAR